jgi:MraZ protein
MMTGEFRASLDEKGRLLIPTKLRAEVAGDTVIVAKGVDRCLRLFTPANWEVFSRSVQESLSMFNPQHLMIQRRLIGSAMELEVDKAGRIGISALQREFAGLSKDCLFLGMGAYVEIWDEAAYTAHADQMESDGGFGAALADLPVIAWPKG